VAGVHRPLRVRAVSGAVPTLPPMSSPTSRTGLDDLLLGTPVPLPTPVDPGVDVVRLDYVHFSVLVRPDRRLAAVAGVGIDGALLRDLDRAGIDWRLDDRLPAAAQAGPELYTRNDLDRGHLVRRADAVWGATVAEAQAGNVDTFHYPNAAPQAASFNQGDQLWLGLETYLLDDAATYDRRLVVHTGPVLDPGDPVYRGVQIPLRFFKVAVFTVPDPADPAGDPVLGATGYLLDQTPQVGDLADVLAEAEAAGQAPPLGPFRTFQVPITDLADLTGLDLAPATAADRFRALTPAADGEPGSSARWRLLTGTPTSRCRTTTAPPVPHGAGPGAPGRSGGDQLQPLVEPQPSQT
jgi:endonuclease G